MVTVDVAVLSLGNVLMGDDAFGPTVLQTLLAGWELPADVEVEDLGTPGLDLMPFLLGRRRIILVDTVRGNREPGQLRRFSREEVLRHGPGLRVSPHDPGLKESLLGLDFRGESPEDFALIGVTPAKVDYAVRMTPALEQAVAPACEQVLQVLREWGVVAEPRAQPLAPELWWREDMRLESQF